MRRRLVAAAVIAVAAAVPATASARTYTNYAGTPTEPPKTAPEGTTLNKFFPAKMKVRKGDSVRYLNLEFHTVTILGKNAQPPKLAVEDPEGGTYAGINAPDGSPFFFNGERKFIYNPEVFGSVGDLTVDDTGTHSTGVYTPDQDGPGARTLEFQRPGKYRVLCLIHPGMKQRVTVLKAKAKGAHRPSKVRAAIAKQAAASFKQATKAGSVAPPVNTVFAGTERKQSAILAFLPGSLLIKPGTSVTFTLDSPSEVHNTVFVGRKQADGTFPAEQYAEQHRAETDLLPPAGNQVAPGFIYGSEPSVSPGAYEYSGDEYGNGFLWTPLMDGLKGDPPNGLPSTQRITFTTPGEYRYFCGIHPFMKGTITVQP